MAKILKSFKYISQIFVVKDREMEIGYPTDVKHVAHIGWDGPSGSAPSWMNEFRAAPDFSTSLGNPRDSGSNMSLSPWVSQDYNQSVGRQPPSEMFKDFPATDLPNVPKKQKRKKKSSSSSTSSPKSSSSTRSSRTSKPKTTFKGTEMPSLHV